MSSSLLLKTCALIDNQSLNMLNTAIKITGKCNMHEIIEAVLKMAIRKYSIMHKPAVSRTVKYQKSNPNLILLHYTVNSNIYESCIAIRVLKKLSVSRILNEGIHEFLGLIISKWSLNSKNIIDHFHEFIKISDNYNLAFKLISHYNNRKGFLYTLTVIILDNKEKNPYD